MAEMAQMVQPQSSLNLPPTVAQTRAITRLDRALGGKGQGRIPIENSPSTRLEARNLIYDLKQRLRRSKSEKV